MSEKTYYALLNVSPNASLNEIKQSYRSLAQKYHPDKTSGDILLAEQFKLINLAYNTLSNSERKKKYDHSLKQNDKLTPYKKNKTSPTNQNKKQSQEKTPFEEIVDEFKNIFKPQKQGAHLEFTLFLETEDILQGCQRNIQYVRNLKDKEHTASVTITVPPDSKENQKITLSGYGDHSLGDEIAGNLIVTLRVDPSSLFEFDGQLTHLNLPLSLIDAVLGCELKIKTPQSTVSMTIPPGTHHNQVFRLKSKGVKSAKQNQPSDLIVKILLDIPQKLTSEQKQLFKKLRSSQLDSPLVRSFEQKLKKRGVHHDRK